MKTLGIWCRLGIVVLSLCVGFAGLAACAPSAPSPAPPAAAPAAAPPTAAPAAKPAGKVFKWRVPGTVAASHFTAVRNVQMMDKVRQQTNGQLDMTLFPLDTLMPGPDVPAATARGTVELASSVTSFTAKVIPVADGLGAPFTGLNSKDWNALLKPGGDLRKLLEPAFLEKGVVLLAVADTGSMGISNKPPIQTLSDWKGKKVRVNGAIAQEVVKTELGATVINLSTPEAVDGMQKGLLDASGGAASNAVVDAYGVPYWTDWAIYGTKFIWYANKAAFDELPADVRSALLAAMAELEQAVVADAGKADADAKAQLQKQGVQIVTPAPAEREKVAKLAEKYNVAWGQKTGPGAQKFMDVVLKTAKKP